ncbi:MAG: 50S ribosomal protein L33 [Candidatus Nealsonbacteria bacterium]|nr:50S ribosomal protein L33 [Candidatus Nealsonbacteria bacterium]
MAKKKRPFVKLQCQTCKRVNYHVNKSKASREKKLELKKFCNWCKKHTPHKESKR